MKTKAVIFDLDGTLFDTRPAMSAAGNYALGMLGLPLLEVSDFSHASGGDIDGFIFYLLEKAGDKEHEFRDDFWRYYLEKTSFLGDDANTVFPEIPVLLKKLNEMGIVCAILSNKDQKTCADVAEKLLGKNTFNVILGYRDGFPGKPHPDGMNLLLQKLGITKDEALYIGDTEIDIKTGKNSGVKTVAALWGYRTKAALDKLDPDCYADSPLEILKYIDQ